jgi:hypothetical protein
MFTDDDWNAAALRLEELLIEREIEEQAVSIAAQESLQNLLGTIADWPAQTPTALRTKACAIRIAFEDELQAAKTEARLLRSLLRDLGAWVDEPS